MLAVIDRLVGDWIRGGPAPEIGFGFEQIYLVAGGTQSSGGGKAGEPPADDRNFWHSFDYCARIEAHDCPRAAERY